MALSSHYLRRQVESRAFDVILDGIRTDILADAVGHNDHGHMILGSSDNMELNPWMPPA